jgi:hypothetical protein
MKWNATYRYRSTSTSNLFVDGGSCYVDPTVTEQLRDTDYGKEVLLGYKMYVKNESRFNPSLGDVVEISMQDGQTFLCTIVGIDFTVHKVYTFSISSSSPRLFSNGSVQFKQKAGGGIDPTTGYPVSTTSTWSESVPCSWKTISLNLLATANNEHYKDAQYSLFIEGNALPSEQLKLADNNGNTLGEFSIISYEYLNTKGVTQIIV